jgi:hypothetical protein
VIDPGTDVVASRTNRDHQGEKMIFMRMRGAGRWRGRPAQQPPLALTRRRLDQRPH